MPGSLEPSTVTPEVTVVIPTRDRAATLPRAIASALAQRDVEVEVIVVDDGSRERVSGEWEPRVRVLHHDAARGASAARNTGLSEARAPLVAFLDDDDLWAPHRCAVLRRSLHESQAGFSYGGVVYVDEDLRPFHSELPYHFGEHSDLLLGLNCVPGGGSAVLARTELVRRCGGWDETLAFAEDWDLWIRLAQIAPAAPVAELVMARVVHRGGSLPGRAAQFARDMRRFADKHEAARRERGVPLDLGWVSRWRGEMLWWSGRRAEAVRAHLDEVRRGDPRALRRAAAAALRPRSRARRTAVYPEWLAISGEERRA